MDKRNKIKIRLSDISLFGLYLPSSAQYIIRLLFVSFLKSSKSFIALFLIILFSLISIKNGKGNLSFILSDAFIDFTIIFLLTSSFRKSYIIKESRMIYLFITLTIIYFLFMIINGYSFFIEDWRGSRLLFLYNGAAGIITSTFFFNYFFYKKKWFLSIICFSAVILSQSRTAGLACLIIPLIYWLKKFKTLHTISIYFTLLVTLISSFLIPLLKINSTGRLEVWNTMLEHRGEINYYGDIYFILKDLFPWEDQVHNLFLHLYLSRNFIVLTIYMIGILYSISRWIKSDNHYALSTFLIIMLFAATDNVLLYYFLYIFWI